MSDYDKYSGVGWFVATLFFFPLVLVITGG